LEAETSKEEDIALQIMTMAGKLRSVPAKNFPRAGDADAILERISKAHLKKRAKFTSAIYRRRGFGCEAAATRLVALLCHYKNLGPADNPSQCSHLRLD